MRKNDRYKVEVQSYVGEPRKLVLWARGEIGWIWQQSMPIPDGLDAAWLENDVLNRLA